MPTVERTMLMLMCPLVAIATASVAHADRYELSLGATTRIMHSASADALGDDTLPAFSLAGAVQVKQVRPFGWDFLIEGGLERGAVEGTSFQTMETSTSITMATIGARLRRPWRSRWMLQARAGVGTARVAVGLGDAFSSVDALRDVAYAASGYLGGGTDYLLVRRRNPDGSDGFSLGVRAELGYQAVMPVALEATPESREGDDDAIRISERSASLGDLNASAMTWRLALVGRF